LIFACIISTLSRGALLASAFSVAVYFCLEIPKSRRSIVLSSAFVACLCLLHIAKRDTAQSDIGRSEAWRVALIEIKRHPLLGVGPDNMEHSYRKEMTPSFDQESWGTTSHANAHNDWLQIGATLGIPALLLYLAAQFLVVIRLLWLGRFAEVAALSAAFIAAKFNPMTICGILYCAILAGREHD
jgi:O-antigen ligase